MIERENGPARTMDVDQRRLWGHLRHLCLDIGPRLTGTRESEQAQEYIVSHLKRCGAECETQEYACPSWEHSSTELTVETAARPEALPALAQTFSQACDVEAVLAGVGTRVELEYASNLEGKILVLYGEAADAVNADRNVVLLTAEERRAAALIVIDLREQVSSKLIRDPFLQIPAAGVSPSTGITLLKNAGRAARLRIRARRFASTGRNLIGRIRGRTDGLIVLAAHYDTAAGCPGAADNASGTAGLVHKGLARARDGGCSARPGATRGDDRGAPGTGRRVRNPGGARNLFRESLGADSHPHRLRHDRPHGSGSTRSEHSDTMRGR